MIHKSKMLHKLIVCFVIVSGTFGFLDFDIVEDDIKSLIKDPDFYLPTFRVEHCGGPGDPVKLNYLEVMPDPIIAPGKLYLTFEMDVRKSIFPPIGVEFEMERLIQGVWTRMPCLYNYFGSCKYDDLCAPFYQLPPVCPKEIQKKIPCKCPIEPNVYDVDSTTFVLGPPGLFMPGIYRTRVQASSLFIKKVMCYTVYFTIKRAKPKRREYD